MRAGDIIRVDFGSPHGSEPGFTRPAVIVTADRVLAARPRTLHVIPLTSNTSRQMPTELRLDDVDAVRGTAQAHLCTVIGRERVLDEPSLVNAGSAALAQLRSMLADLLDIP